MRSGFTVIEVLVGVVITAVLVGLSVPLYRGYLTDRALQNAAHLIQADLRLAQQTAVARSGSGPRVEVCFRNGGYDVYAVDYTDPMNPSPGSTQIGATVKAAGAAQEFAAGMVISVSPPPGAACANGSSGPVVAFSGAGSPISGAQQTVTLAWRGRSYRVIVEAVTGRATVSR
jgi:prepilin-type N-terminal cleavage/methylation domain-containing protein